MAVAKNLGNLPPNICHPAHVAEQAQAMAREFNLECEVLERADMEKLGMHSLLSVAQGSHQPPKLIVLSHKGGKASEKPIVLVGKGVTFDTGGISIKPAAGNDGTPVIVVTSADGKAVAGSYKVRWYPQQ